MTSEPIIMDSQSEAIRFLCKKDKRLAKAIEMIGPLVYMPHDDSYRFLVGQIINQMLSNKAAAVIYQRLENMCGGTVDVNTISALTDSQIRSIGTANSKVRYIRCLTEAVINKDLDFNYLECLSDDEAIKYLTRIKGIGVWSAKMYLIFCLDRKNVLPIEDVAFQQVYKWLYKTEDVSKQSITKRCKKWTPYSSIAARYFYKLLDQGYTKEEFHLYK